jgi:AraC-like DNA-binding protein
VEPAAILQTFPKGSRNRGNVWHHQPAYWRPPHFHPEPELNFVGRGQARVAVGQAEVTLRPGSVVWFLPGQSHALLEASADLDLWVVGLTMEYAEAVLGAALPLPAGSPYHCRLDPGAEGRLFDRCRSSLEGTYDGGGEAAAAAIFQLARSGAIRAPERPIDPLVLRALLRLVAKPESSRRGLASQLRVSEAGLSRRFRAEIGLSFQEYRHRLRVMRFIECLRPGDRRWVRAALGAGFGSYSQFFRTFSHVVGYSPSGYLGAGREVLEQAVASELSGR